MSWIEFKFISFLGPVQLQMSVGLNRCSSIAWTDKYKYTWRYEVCPVILTLMMHNYITCPERVREWKFFLGGNNIFTEFGSKLLMWKKLLNAMNVKCLHIIPWNKASHNLPSRKQQWRSCRTFPNYTQKLLAPPHHNAFMNKIWLLSMLSMVTADMLPFQ